MEESLEGDSTRGAGITGASVVVAGVGPFASVAIVLVDRSKVVSTTTQHSCLELGGVAESRNVYSQVLVECGISLSTIFNLYQVESNQSVFQNLPEE